jgi:hypothetical protein
MTLSPDKTVLATTPSPAAGGSAQGRAIVPVVVRIATGLAATALLVAAARLPVWRAVFHAPQYPQGLNIAAYGNKVDGDLGEITELSHYIGMPPLNFVAMPEMKLWPVAIGLAIVATVLALATKRKWLRRVAATFLWLLPVGALGVVQFRLWQTGHSLDPTSPIRVTPFTPKVVGPTNLMNFTVQAYPGMALVLILAAAALVTALPFVIRRPVRDSVQAVQAFPAVPAVPDVPAVTAADVARNH